MRAIALALGLTLCAASPGWAEEDADAPALLEALDSLPGECTVWTGSRGRPFSEEGLRRLREANAQLRRLSARAGLDPADLIAEVVREIGLDVEVALRPGPSAVSARRHLDAFQDAARGFAAGEGAASSGHSRTSVSAGSTHSGSERIVVVAPGTPKAVRTIVKNRTASTRLFRGPAAMTTIRCHQGFL